MKNQTREAQINSLVEQLTLKEKIGMIHGAGLFRTEGVSRLGIPPLKMADGPMGVRNDFEDAQWTEIGHSDDYVTYLPSNSGLASTWNINLAREMGEVLGAEARGRGKDVILAPGINIKRSPLCGRNFEYMSEDPRLNELMSVPLIQGIQSFDVAGCVKHFAANAQETERLWVDTHVEERVLREIYFPGFRASVQEGDCYTLMGAYNLLRGEHCCESQYLLNTVLREEWGYQGVVISDWSAVHRTKEAAESALDIEMSVTDDFDDYCMANPLIKMIESGEVSEDHVDQKVGNILRLMFKLKMIGAHKSSRKSGTYNTPEHRQSVLKVARESIVLLKNEGLLPIDSKTVKKVAVIGKNAEMIHSDGGGSAEIKALYEISPLMGIKKLLGGNVEVVYAEGYFMPKKNEASELNWQATSVDGQEENKEAIETTKGTIVKKDELRLRDEAVRLAQEADCVIYVGGLNHDYDLEGQDRKDMHLPYGQDCLIEALLEANEDTIVTMVAGSPVEMPWVQKAKSIVWSWYAGMEGGTALAEVLFGQVNPSGRLPETFPLTLSESPAHVYGDFGNKDHVTFREGLYVGYRYFDTYDVVPLFPFGHGLSYTSFDYKDLRINCGNIQVTITNTGSVAGSEVVQLYVSYEDDKVIHPKKMLKGFAKVSLEAGESEVVTIALSKKDFTYYDERSGTFLQVDGKYKISIGSSSRTLKLQREITQYDL